MIAFLMLDPSADPYHTLGYIPSFLDEYDPRPAKEQFDEHYVSGWRPFPGFTKRGIYLSYPGDPIMRPLAMTSLRDEVIVVYPHAWVCIVQPDDTFEVCRMD